jgi:large subunit ribosomal protein L22
MELKASCRYVLHSPRKMRRVADIVRGKDLDEALDILRFVPNRAAYHISRVLRSAQANAFNFKGEEQVDKDHLYVKTIYINEGARYKRIMYRAYGRASRVMKPTCHIHVVLDERPEEEFSRRMRRKISEKPVKAKGKKAEKPKASGKEKARKEKKEKTDKTEKGKTGRTKKAK